MDNLDLELLETLDPRLLGLMVFAATGLVVVIGLALYRLVKFLIDRFLTVQASHTKTLVKHGLEIALAREERADLRRGMDDVMQISEVVKDTASNVQDLWELREQKRGDDKEPVKKKVRRRDN